MRPFLRSAASTLLRATLRALPWVVTTGALALGSWVFRTMIPIASHGGLAAVGITVVLLRTTAAIAAISAGAFALGAGLEGRWFSADHKWRRRFTGLAVLGATGVAAGTFVLFGWLAGFSSAHSLGVVGTTGLLAGLAAWSTWSLRRGRDAKREPAALSAPSPADDWLARDLGRVRTPAN